MLYGSFKYRQTEVVVECNNDLSEPKFFVFRDNEFRPVHTSIARKFEPKLWHPAVKPEGVTHES